jgi:3'(2'), 5'-bisphosphate nucleotidase
MQDKLARAMRKIGARILECRREGDIGGVWVDTQFKAHADLIANECLKNELKQIVDIPIVSEEDISSQSTDRPAQYWLIDPIDGTASFSQGFSGFVCQAALIKDGQPWLASVYAPALRLLYLAELGKGSTVNSQLICVKPLNRRQLTLIDNYPEPRGVSERLFRDFQCANYIESGSIGLKICLVAQGKADIFVKDVFVRDWDVAAPHLVLLEAGGVLHQFGGQSFDYKGGYEKKGLIVTSTPALSREIIDFAASY